MLACAALIACRGLTLDQERVIAIEVPTTTPRVQEGDTLRLTARLLNAAGVPVPGAAATWATDDTVTSFTLDQATGLVTAIKPGTGRVWARFDALMSGPLTLTVTARPAPALVPVAGSPPRPVIPTPQ